MVEIRNENTTVEGNARFVDQEPVWNMITACTILYELLKSVGVHTTDKGWLQVQRFV